MAKIRNIRKELREKGAAVVIVASYGTFSTGISIKNIHNIFLTESFKSDTIIRQSIGRGLRKLAGKGTVKIVDFVDDFRKDGSEKEWVNYIYKHGQERRRIYREEKFPYTTQQIRF